MGAPKSTLKSQLPVTLALLGLSLTTGWAAPIFEGTLYFTNSSGVNNVNKIAFNYDQGTQILTLGAPINVARTPGADGIIL